MKKEGEKAHKIQNIQENSENVFPQMCSLKVLQWLNKKNIYVI